MSVFGCLMVTYSLYRSLSWCCTTTCQDLLNARLRLNPQSFQSVWLSGNMNISVTGIHKIWTASMFLSKFFWVVVELDEMPADIASDVQYPNSTLFAEIVQHMEKHQPLEIWLWFSLIHHRHSESRREYWLWCEILTLMYSVVTLNGKVASLTLPMVINSAIEPMVIQNNF